MTKTSKIILVTIIATSILLGLGYAAIQNITLNITGNVTANPNQGNFKVKFTTVVNVSDSSYVTANVLNDTNATINVSGLKNVGEKATATYEILNGSNDLSADLNVLATNSNTEYFVVSSKIDKTSLTAGEKTNLVVTVELNKTLIESNESTNINIKLDAIPVEPGKEGTSGVTNDYSQSPGGLESITKDNYGDYIDLGNDIVDFNGKSNVTTDDWRILYKDNEYVHVILSSYLPAELVPSNTGIETDASYYKYSVWSFVSGEVLVNGIKNEGGKFNFLASDILNAKVIASPTADMIEKSYFMKYDEEIELLNSKNINTGYSGSDLYVPYTDGFEMCYGYWLAEYSEKSPDFMDVGYVSFSGSNNYGSSTGAGYGLRPVVSIPINTEVEIVDNVWVIKK